MFVLPTLANTPSLGWWCRWSLSRVHLGSTWPAAVSHSTVLGYVLVPPPGCQMRWVRPQGRNLMAPYLPPSASGSPYSEGGALYALGLIHANHGQAIRGFLLESLRGTSHEARAPALYAPSVLCMVLFQAVHA